jgi:hypothetical protein
MSLRRLRASVRNLTTFKNLVLAFLPFFTPINADLAGGNLSIDINHILAHMEVFDLLSKIYLSIYIFIIQWHVGMCIQDL